MIFDGAVPPWGRSAAEYEAFFALSDVPPSARILDCGGGPSSFAAEWSRNGRYVVAADPMYRFSTRDFLADFDLTAAQMLTGMQKARDRFKWDYYGSPEGVVQRRRDVLTAFIADFQAATRRGRYVSACLPELPFLSQSFDLVLCSHLLFLYSAEFDAEMHLSFLRELLRVGREVLAYFHCSTWMVTLPRIWRTPFRHCERQHALSLFHCPLNFGLAIRKCCV